MFNIPGPDPCAQQDKLTAFPSARWIVHCEEVRVDMEQLNPPCSKQYDAKATACS